MQGLLVVDDLHATPAQDVGGPHQHRITDGRGDLAGLLEARGGAELRCGQTGVDQDLAEPAAILGQVDGLGPGADDRHPGGLESVGQPERGLPAELDDRAHHARTARPGTGFGVVDLQHVLECEWFEIQPVCGVVVGRDGLRVAVDHDGLEPGLRQRGRRMHAAVVELDALADPVGSGAENQNLGLVGLRRHLRLRRRVELIGRVVVRGLGLELRRAGVDGLVHRVDVEAAAQRPHTGLAGQFGTQGGDLAVGKSVVLGAPQQIGIQDRGPGQLRTQGHQRVDLIDEPRVDPGGFGYLLDGCAES